MCLVAGRQGSGKTTWAAYMLAALTNGQPLPGDDAAVDAIRAGILSLEEPADRLTARLHASGADLSRVLARDFPNDFLFKGGTSLSKGYHLIERFSDDIDILVLARGRGRGATDRLMKEMAERAAEVTGGVASSFGASETGRHRAFDVSYPATRLATAIVRKSVLLEMEVRGGDHPHDTVDITPLLGDALVGSATDPGGYADLSPFSVVVLHPARTLLEKLTAVHAEALRLDADLDRQPDRRIGRHFYDIHELLGDTRVQAVLDDRAEVGRIIAEIAEVNRTHFHGSETEELRPEDGFATSKAFAPGTPVADRLAAAYDSTMSELYFGSSPCPTWDEVCDRVTAAANEL